MRSRSFAILWAAGAILLLVGLYLALQDSTHKHHGSGLHSGTFTLSIAAPSAGQESPIFVVTQGDAVTMIIGSDRPGEVHVHGYEKKVVLIPRGEVRLQFVAEHPGGFPVHLHDPDGSMHGLAMLEVQPN